MIAQRSRLDVPSLGIKQIKHAYDAGINTFDTANAYSNGVSEEILGKAIKQHNLPRDEIVVMTKVYFTVARGTKDLMALPNEELDKQRYVNQHGLSRKVRTGILVFDLWPSSLFASAYL